MPGFIAPLIIERFRFPIALGFALIFATTTLSGCLSSCSQAREIRRLENRLAVVQDSLGKEVAHFKRQRDECRTARQEEDLNAADQKRELAIAMRRSEARLDSIRKSILPPTYRAARPVPEFSGDEDGCLIYLGAETRENLNQIVTGARRLKP